MAKSAKEEESAAPDAAPKLVLKKNHGMVIHGRVNKFYPAGTEFHLEDDAALIAQLIQSGATLE